MKNLKPSKCFAAAALILSLMPVAHAQQQISPLQIAQLQAGLFQGQELLNDKMSPKEQAAMKVQTAQYLASLGMDPAATAQSKEVDLLAVQDLSQKDTTEEELNMLKSWARSYDEGTLKAKIAAFIAQLKQSPTDLGAQVRALPPEKEAYAVNALNNSIEAVIKMRGLTGDTSFNTYYEWSRLSEKMTKRVDKSQKKERDLLDLAEESKWIRTESAEVLVNGPASFAKRDQMMADANQSINIMTWSIYDDVTGKQLVNLLLDKKQKNPNLQIRVIIDGQVAATPGHDGEVKRLEAAGIPVMRWFNKEYTYVGQHRKMMIVDNQHMVAGGLNFGDFYSHKNPDEKIARWRDTDVYIKGAGAAEGNVLFAKIWNEQRQSQGKKKFAEMEVGKTVADPSGIEIALIDHDPIQYQDGSPIMLTILKAIRESKKQVDIENAYIILFPALKNELRAAAERGVQVRVLTNSGESVDEPVVSIPILRSVSEFIKMGALGKKDAKTYTKKGVTLHSKFMVVDSMYSMIMSYNLHPRSERVEGEMAVLIRDAKFAENMHRVFEQDIAPDQANELKTLEDLKMPKSAVSIPTLRLFFDML